MPSTAFRTGCGICYQKPERRYHALRSVRPDLALGADRSTATRCGRLRQHATALQERLERLERPITVRAPIGENVRAGLVRLLRFNGAPKNPVRLLLGAVVRDEISRASKDVRGAVVQQFNYEDQ